MALYFLEAAAGQRPAKRFSLDNQNNLQIISYPHIKRFNSHKIEAENISELHEALIHGASKNTWILLKGQLDETLENESRAGHTRRDDSTQFIVFDIDGLDVASIEQFLGIIGLANTSYVIQWSASYGIHRNNQPVKSGLRAHIYMWLDSPVPATKLKIWFQTLNLQFFSDQMDLTPTGHGLTWPVDPSVADNSKLIYIAPPIVEEPFEDRVPPGERIVLVEKNKATMPAEIITAAHRHSQIATRVEQQVLKLRKDSGLPKRRTKIKQYKNLRLLDNPDTAVIHYIGTERGYSYYNLNGGDSASYYHKVSTPDIVFCFKPGEMPFRHSDVDPESHINAVERAREFQMENGEEIYGVGRDVVFDKHFTYSFNSSNDDLMVRNADKQNLVDFLANHDQLLPEPIPDWILEFDPTDDRVIDHSGRWINLYNENELGREYRGVLKDGEITYETGPIQLKQRCPLIYELIGHVIAYHDETYQWFLNWLAHVVQVRTKPLTAIVLHGVPGTGKNLLVEQVLTPLIGQEYVKQIRMEQLKDQFTGWLKTCRLLMINEANQIGMGQSGDQTGEMLKNLITEQALMIRQMRREGQMLNTFNAVIIASNNHAPIIIDESDRRITVAPRQEQRLTQLGGRNLFTNFPEIERDLQKETKRFAQFIYEYTIEADRVVQTLENVYKETMKDAGKTSIDEFAEAVKSGNIDYFLEYLPCEISQLTMIDTAAGTASAIRQIMKNFLQNLNQPMVVPRSQLEILYAMVTGIKPASMNKIKFGKMMSKHGVYIRPGLRQAGSQKTVRGVRVTWQLTNMTPQEAFGMIDDVYSGDFNIGDNPYLKLN